MSSFISYVIYPKNRISYCSADATHDHVFAFINSTDAPDSDSCPSGSESTDGSSSRDSPDSGLVLHAFLCQKRKIAQSVTLTVAKSFETAFQIWQDENERRRSSCSSSSSQQQQQKQNQHTQVIQHHHQTTQNEVDTMRNLLIDFSSEMDITSELCSKDQQQYFQNTWVSFEDESSNDSLKLPPINYNTNMWDSNAMIMT